MKKVAYIDFLYVASMLSNPKTGIKNKGAKEKYLRHIGRDGLCKILPIIFDPKNKSKLKNEPSNMNSKLILLIALFPSSIGILARKKE